MFSFEFLTSKVSEDSPCGPDLDLLGDGDFLQFMASVDSDLPDSSKPGSFFDFDRQEKQLPKKIAAMKGLLEQTRDLRLLVTLAKMQILDRQTDPFLTTIKAIDHLIATFWQDVHPQAEDGDLTLRINSLEALDDFAQVVLPVQNITLFRSRRAGVINYRTFMLSSGEIQPREKDEVKEPVIEPAAFESVLFDIQGADPAQSAQELVEMIASREQFQALRASLASIQTNSQELLDFQGSIKFDRLFNMVGDIAGFLERTIIRRDPAAAVATEKDATSPGEGGIDGTNAGDAYFVTTAVPTGAVKTLEEVASALGAVGRYFARHEPSSPALLLVRQAQGLVGRSFFDALRALLPSHASEANLLMGAAPGFNMSVERLAEIASDYSEPEQALDAENEPDFEAADTFDRASVDEETSDDVSSDTGESVQIGTERSEDEDASRFGTEASPPASPTRPSGPKHFNARSRSEALGLMMAVQSYYSAAEPSSPIPLLIDRARGLANADFSALLKLVMPKHSFRHDDDM